MITDFGLSIIALFEQFRPSIYLDAVGRKTIGYGHLIKSGEHFDRPLTMDEARDLLGSDAEEASHGVDKYVSVPHALIGPRHDALISWTFNLGVGNLAKSTMLQRINEGAQDDEVVQEMIRWVHGKGKRLPGLVRRRYCEAIWYMGAPRPIITAIARGEYK